ncbi:hypothetical protein ACYZUD_02940 [Pseudomonas sp. XS1P51]
MNRNEYLHRSAELLFLEKQLAKPGLSKLSAMSIRSRIDEAKSYLEANGQDTYQPAKVILTQAIDLITELLEATTKSDEELSEPVSRLADRAISSVSDFLAKLSSYDASCSLTTRTRRFQFADSEQVRRSKARLSLDNIKETTETFTGEFIGALPDKRAFEFRTSDGSVIYGGIPREIPDPNAVNLHLYKTFNITLSAKRIGSSKPRYMLQRFPWTD